MKVYVDELPKDCIGCPCESEYYCNLLKEDIGCCKWGEIHKNCPLIPLSDHDEQVRKEVVEEKNNTISTLIADNEASKELLKKQLAEKDKEIEKIKSYNIALFASLYQILEKEDSENVSSRIDQLTAQNNSYTSDLYKCNKWYDRLDKSLQLACEYMCKYDIPCPNNKCEQKQCLEDKSFCYYTYFKFKAMEELDNE